MKEQLDTTLEATELRLRAENWLRRRRGTRDRTGGTTEETDPRRLLHELQVHQVELEVQNAELQEARDRLEILLRKYTDLYDFAPVGYFSLNETGRILEANLTGASLLGVERARLIDRRFQQFLPPTDRSDFLRFLGQVFAADRSHACEATLRHSNGSAIRVELQAVWAASPPGSPLGCRLAVSDISYRQRAEEARRRTEALTATNRELREEIARRLEVEQALRQSQLDQARLLAKAKRMHQHLRSLSHRILQAQEDERRRISRELHDEISQTLVGIGVQLETLNRESRADPVRFERRIVRTQRLVEKSVNIVHQFARELRPTALDDLGLIAALQSYVRDFVKRTGIRVRFLTCAAVENMSAERLTVVYRVVQSALTNVAQHARASRVTLNIRKVAAGILLEIADDGRAFDVECVFKDRRNKRLGLLGMRERVEMVGGELRIDSAPGRGTTIRAHFPPRKTARRSAARTGGPPFESAFP